VKKDIHPTYDYVVFRDKSANFALLTRSTLQPEERVIWTDGKEYPVFDVEISSASHPFYTGNQRIVDTAGRIERFNRRFTQR
jgi:large subunit ribosomal protein L31